MGNFSDIRTSSANLQLRLFALGYVQVCINNEHNLLIRFLDREHVALDIQKKMYKRLVGELVRKWQTQDKYLTK